MASPLDALGRFLEDTYNNPLAYISLTFVYAIAVAIVLPIPIEAALLAPLLDRRYGYLIGITLALAAGKTIGAWLIFLLGVNVEGSIRRWSERWRFAKWFVEKAEKFVARTGNLGLYILLSIPLMTDTIPLYLYSLFNEEGKALDQRMYLAANFLAALNRVAVLVIIFLVGVNLFGL
ncbi:MAG: hypothetical protein A3K59_03640 [Euryarchaeota archaeon RBG_19FT_COMBO_69_17]|uniref:VTT domain-containing protein n=2 Tax=environmental samples TaxID=68359 RepID=A0A0H4T243_9EURY|nr:hypothetical protein [uncultured euryarchaeote Rifle_16ft_4_minimus_23719]AKQ02729.1 hypothetical protein [uncultured euryarchaeote Rifle_16ft_4_minimus_37664]OGS62125.1 MAG: hypothetical protein A3K59_03640 [Euryarchaeota archaeon RBG_19FT_COMBO_69_17]